MSNNEIAWMLDGYLKQLRTHFDVLFSLK